ncbi:hypothetical protein CCZ01_09770, partial [Helicobacter monodelphidis]|uniref:Cj0814 family flagellar-dependent secreted protein n=1 Tax=Helicobacter sp. 15-1451 TaxID=2004995 RepID=UPI000DCF2CAA
VDADGYFTSDFNEKAGIPKDFRIRAADMQKFVDDFFDENTFSGRLNSEIFKSIDIAKSFGNIYQLFSQVLESPAYGEDFSKEYLDNLSITFYEYNSRTLKVIQTLTQEDMEKVIKTDSWATVMKDHKKNDIGWIFNSKSDFSSYSKGDVFLEFAKYAPVYGVFEGETTLRGNAFGYNKNIDESIVEDFRKFMDSVSILTNRFGEKFGWDGQGGDISQIKSHIKQINNILPLTPVEGDRKALQDILSEANDLLDEYMEKLSSPDLSFSEFKERYVEFSEKYYEFRKRHDSVLDKAWANYTEHEENQKPFKPIQGESDNTETYQDEFKKTFFERFLKAEQEKGNDITEILEQLSKIGYKFSG